MLFSIKGNARGLGLMLWSVYLWGCAPPPRAPFPGSMAVTVVSYHTRLPFWTKHFLATMRLDWDADITEQSELLLPAPAKELGDIVLFEGECLNLLTQSYNSYAGHRRGTVTRVTRNLWRVTVCPGWCLHIHWLGPFLLSELFYFAE